MANINRWWAELPAESFWLEITDRPDLGADLNAPQVTDGGDEYWGYALICEAHEGDIVYHYHKDFNAIVAASVVTGDPWEDTVIWGARGTYARAKDVKPYARAGWRRALTGFRPIDEPVTLTDIRSRYKDIALIRERLAHMGPLYLPFELSNKRPLRPMQAYFSKLPSELVDLFPALSAVLSDQSPLSRANSGVSESSVPYDIGTTYRYADEIAAVSERDPFAVDPALVERGYVDMRSPKTSWRVCSFR